MRIYLAAPFAARNLALGVADTLHKHGLFVTSTWVKGTREIHDGTIGASLDSPVEVVASHAGSDLDDIDTADAVLMLSSSYVLKNAPTVKPEWLHTGGRHVEVGYALGIGRHVYILGEPENVFARALCSVHEDLQTAIARIKEDFACIL